MKRWGNLSQDGGISHFFGDVDVDAVHDATQGDTKQDADKLECIHVKSKSNWLRVEDGADQFPLGGSEPSLKVPTEEINQVDVINCIKTDIMSPHPNDYSEDLVQSVIAGLEDLSPTKKSVAFVDVGAVRLVEVWNGRFRLRCALA